jgi:hypothetical protein
MKGEFVAYFRWFQENGYANIQNSRSPNRDPKRGSVEHETVVLVTRWQRSVNSNGSVVNLQTKVVNFEDIY